MPTTTSVHGAATTIWACSVDSMYRFITALFLALAFCGAAQTEGLARRAQRAFDSGEWASAQALYGLVTDREPDDTGAQSRLLTAAVMRGDSASIVPVVERAMAAGVPLGAMLDSLKTDLRAASGYALYPGVLEHLAAGRAYMRRPLMTHMLDFYTERRDGANMVRCARGLLAGLPDSPHYLDALAQGLLYTGDRAGAEESWRKALEADPGDVKALLSLAALLGHTPEALDLLRRADAVAPSPAIKQRIKSFSDE